MQIPPAGARGTWWARAELWFSPGIPFHAIAPEEGVNRAVQEAVVSAQQPGRLGQYQMQAALADGGLKQVTAQAK